MCKDNNNEIISRYINIHMSVSSVSTKVQKYD